MLAMAAACGPSSAPPLPQPVAAPARPAADEAVALADHLTGAEPLANPRQIALAAPESETLLREGWATPRPQPGEPLAAVWADAPISVLEVPLAHPAPLGVSMRAAPLDCPGCEPMSVAIDVNGTRITRLELIPGGFHDYTFEVPADRWRYRDNTLTFHWSRVVAPADFDPNVHHKLELAAAVVSISLSERGRLGPAPSLPRPADGLRTKLDQAWAFYVELPVRASLAGAVRCEPCAAGSPAGVARVTLRADGGEERELFAHELTGPDPIPFDLDLAGEAGRVSRLSLRFETSTSFTDSGAAWDDVALRSAAGPIDPDRLFGRSRVKRRSPAPPLAQRPDVILYLMDALRASALGCYGQPRPTSPHLDRLSRSALLFASTTSQGSSTPPSIKALLTGRYLPTTGTSPLSPSHPTLADVLGRSGYRTAIFSSSPWPAAVGVTRGFGQVARDLYSGAVAAWFDDAAPKRGAADVSERFLEWLPAGSRFFAYLHTLHPHNPYSPPPPWGRLDRPARPPIRGDTDTLTDIRYGRHPTPTPAELLELTRLYLEDVHYNDHELGRLVASLGARGAWNDTVLAFTSDHGEELLEHAGVLHGFNPHSEMIGVPLILRLPGSASGAVFATAVEHVDLVPTLLAVTGADPPADLEGRSLLDPRAADAFVVLHSSASSTPGIFTMVRGRYKYVFAPRDGQGIGIGEGAARVRRRFFLFDLVADPRELDNVVDDHPVLATCLHRSLRAWLDAEASEPELPPDMDEEMKGLLQSLGYLEDAPSE